PLSQEFQKLDFDRRGRRKINVTGFGGGHAIAFSVKKQSRGPESGSRREQRPIPALELSLVDRQQLIRSELADSPTRGFEIVDQVYALDPELRCERCRLHHPRKIGSDHAAFDHRSGYAKAGRGHAPAFGLEKLGDYRVQVRMSAARKAAFDARLELTSRRLE